MKVILLFLVVFLTACQTQKTHDKSEPSVAHVARDSLDWRGTYESAPMPCKNDDMCQRMIEIELADGMYAAINSYSDKLGGRYGAKSTGKWRWIDGNRIELFGADIGQEYPLLYWVAENALYPLDAQGNKPEHFNAEQGLRKVLALP